MIADKNHKDKMEIKNFWLYHISIQIFIQRNEDFCKDRHAPFRCVYWLKPYHFYAFVINETVGHPYFTHEHNYIVSQTNRVEWMLTLNIWKLFPYICILTLPRDIIENAKLTSLAQMPFLISAYSSQIQRICIYHFRHIANPYYIFLWSF